MGLFDNKRDDNQDADLRAIERHIRALTERVDMARVDIARLKLDMVKLTATVGGKVDAEQVDPAMGDLNELLRDTRVKAEEVSKAADETWDGLQADVMAAVDHLMSRIDSAADRSDQEKS